MSKTNTYELAFLALAQMSEKDVNLLQSTFADAVTQAGGQVVSTGDVHFIRLAYEMTKKVGSKNTRHNEAYFSWMKLSIDPSAVQDIDALVRGDANILRYMIINTLDDDSVTNVFSLEQDEEEVAESDNEEVAGEVAELDEAEEETKEESVTPDDLTKIEGIGPVIATTLVNAGVATYAQLADIEADAVREMLEGVRGNHDPSTWAQQAALARDEKWDELQSLQDELDGGKA